MSEPVNIVIDHIDEKSVAEYLSLIEDMLIEANIKNKRLKEENAKLRELVWDMWHEGAFQPGACYVYEADRLEERTRELGIEVEQ